ncbi:MAG: sulfotransferase family 2 domain-containing protein [Planctomycetaceae bacterium]
MIFRKAEPLLFEHVPKCAGTSVSHYLKQNYNAEEIFELNGGRPSESIAAFQRYSEADRTRFRLILGHGAHQLWSLVSPLTIGMTILRNPVDRIVSHYYFVLASPKHYLHEQVVTRRMSLSDYATSGISGELRNNYVCRFLQITPEEAEREPDSSVENAYSRLKAQYAVIGILEQLNQTMNTVRRIARLRGRWKNEQRNVNKRRRLKDEITSDERTVISEINALDVRLYERIAADLEHQSLQLGS